MLGVSVRVGRLCLPSSCDVAGIEWSEARTMAFRHAQQDASEASD
jgi:hypothetical protein